RCRIYAPVGTHQTLLPYLVRRLLENGANTSFVHQIVNPQIELARLIEHPIVTLRRQGVIANPACTPAPNLFGDKRLNSKGLDLFCKRTVLLLERTVATNPLPGLPPLSYSTKAQVDDALNKVIQLKTSGCDWFDKG
ncbi:MAG: proline dehydrogenase family protein, partial [Limnobacter sp.]